MNNMHARLLDCTPAQYHADPTGGIALSSSIAKILLDRSSLHAWYAHPKLGAGPHEATAAMNRGSIIHKLLLGKGAEIAIINHDDYRKTAAKEERDAALNAGRIPIKIGDYAEISSAAEAIRARLNDLGFDLGAMGSLVEQAIEWDEEGQHGPVRCRAMMDWVNVASGQILDVKSIEDGSEESAARAVFRYGYHLQSAAYRSALDTLRTEHGLDGASTFTFLFCELEPPYGVLPAKLSGAFQEIGQSRWRAAVRKWEHCLINNDFPGYARETVRLEPPGWALSQMMGEEA
jgi:hypothetical protein